MRLAVWLALAGLAWGGADAARAQSAQPAQPAPDGLMLQEGAWMIDLTPFLRRTADGDTGFVLRNDGDKDLSLELELTPSPLMALGLAPAPRLRLFDSLGREFVAAPDAPHRLAFTLPQGQLTYFAVRAAESALPSQLGLRLWSGAARQDFAARLASVRWLSLFLLAPLYAAALLAGMLARAWDGLLAAASGALALSAYALSWGASGPPLFVFGLGGAALLLWLGFHARALAARMRLYPILLALVDGSLFMLAALFALAWLMPQWQGLRAFLLTELVFASMLLALGLGSFSLAALTRLAARV